MKSNYGATSSPEQFYKFSLLLIAKRCTGAKIDLGVWYKTELERKNIDNSHVTFEFYWWQKQQQAEAYYLENTQPHEDNQLEEKHPDHSVRSQKGEGTFFQLLSLSAYDGVKEK